MRLVSGLPWALPVCLAVNEAPDGVESRSPTGGRPLALLEVERGLRVRQGARGRELLPDDRRHAPVAAAAQKPRVPRGPRDRLRAPRACIPRACARSGRDAALRRARVELRGRLPDAEPDPPRARVRRRSRSRPSTACSSTRSSGTRRATTSPPTCASTATGAARRLLPRRPRPALGIPGGDALRGAEGGDLARDLPQELRLLALHRRPRPRGRRHLLRHLRRAVDLRRASRRTSSTSSRCSSSTRSSARRAGRWRAQDVPARQGGSRLPVGDEGARNAGALGRCLRRSSRGERSQGS